MWGGGGERSRSPRLREGRLSGGQDTSLEGEQGGRGERGTRFPDKGTAHAMAWLSERTWHPGRPRSLHRRQHHIRGQMVQQMQRGWRWNREALMPPESPICPSLNSVAAPKFLHVSRNAEHLPARIIITQHEPPRRQVLKRTKKIT